jgi:hypothetical protein
MTTLIYKGREIDTSGLEFGQFDYREENPWLESAEFMDGTPLTDSELDDLADDRASELHMIFMNNLY